MPALRAGACGVALLLVWAAVPAVTLAAGERGEVGWSDRIVAAALAYVGTRWTYGGNDRSGIDCSGLVWAACRDAGRPIHRMSVRRMAEDFAVASEPTTGDLALFSTSLGPSPDHVGLWLRAGASMVHAGKSTGVEAREIDSQGGYWRRRLVGTVRLPEIELLRGEAPEQRTEARR